MRPCCVVYEDSRYCNDSGSLRQYFIFPLHRKPDKKQFFSLTSHLNCAVIRKLLIATILLSMGLHCGCRLGFLDQLYRCRYAIAISIGLITEVPIPICSSHHDYRTGLTIKIAGQSESIPPLNIRTEAINLFIVAPYSLPESLKAIPAMRSPLALGDLYKLVLANRLFRPPASVY